MNRPVQIVDVVLFFSVAAVVTAIIDRLARRGLQVARAQAEAEALARLAGGSVLAGADALPDLVAELRRTFDLDGVAILSPSPGGTWFVAASAGGPIPDTPDHAPFSAELDDGAVLVLTGSDLSGENTRLLGAFVAQLRQAQEHLRLEGEAASASELAEATSLRGAQLAAVSQDLRTPLASITAAATSLLSSEVAWDHDQAKSFAKTIKAESDRLTQLVANLLDMSRLQVGAVPIALQAVNVNDLLYRAVANLGSGASGVVIDAAEALPAVSADPVLLERALANVIDNAVTWSPLRQAVRVEAAVAGDRVDICVVDQGPGVPREQRDQLFLPFERLGDGGGGSPNGIGLGLAVARGFTRAIGGELTVEDTPGGGATFVFSLRRAQP